MQQLFYFYAMIDVTCALIISHGKILAAQNDEFSDHPLQWEFPGGKIDEGESAEDCILREIREEMEITVRVIRPLLPVVHDYGFKKIRLISFICEKESGDLRLNDHQNVEWFSLQELKTLDLSAADRVLIEKEENLESLKEYLREQVNDA